MEEEKVRVCLHSLTPFKKERKEKEKKTQTQTRGLSFSFIINHVV